MFCASRRGRVCQDAPIRIRKKYVTVFMKTGTKRSKGRVGHLRDVVAAPKFSVDGLSSECLVDTEFLGIPIKDKPLTRDERNLQQAARTVVSLARDTLDKRMTLEQRIPYGREIFSLPQQLGA